MMKIFYILLGLFLGLWFSWPGIFNPSNWKCFNDIISNAVDEKISIKAILAVSPNYVFKRNKKNKVSKIRIVSDACFR